MKNVIKISKSINYLSEAMEELPKDCLFDKGKVGCGGTTIALTSKENYIIAVPFVSLIQNKVEQVYKYPNVLGVYKGIEASDIKEYCNGQGVKKIMVTYDSLARLMQYINPLDYNLLIDEYHLLFTQYSFRKDAVQTVLNNYRAFKSFCFMTATVLDEEFLLDELKGIDVTVAEWEGVNTVRVHSVKCDKEVNGTVIQLIKEYLTGEKEGNAYIFVNSVEFIKEMVDKCGLTEDNCRVIYSKNNKTDVGIANGNTMDCKTDPKRINMLTSTAFEGSDIYDENGNILIVSDNKRPQTLTDISTSFQQIAGRIRNTKYWSTITHLYTSTRYSGDLTYDEFKAVVKETIDTTKKSIIEFNNLSEFSRNMIDVDVEYYIEKNADNTFSFDANLVNIDLYNFKICKNLYNRKVNITNSLINEGFVVIEHTSHIEESITRMDKLENKFQLTVEKLLPIAAKGEFYIDSEMETDQELYKAACVRYPFLSSAISIMGFDGIKEMNYNVTNIKREVIKKIDANKAAKVVKMLKTHNDFNTGSFITAKKAKEVLQGIYSELGIEKSPNIKDYYEVKTASKRVKGVIVNGYYIMLPKMIIKA